MPDAAMSGERRVAGIPTPFFLPSSLDVARCIICFDGVLAHDIELLQGVGVLGVLDVPDVLVDFDAVDGLPPSSGLSRPLLCRGDRGCAV